MKYLALDLDNNKIVDENKNVYSFIEAKKLIEQNKVDRTLMVERFIFQFNGDIFSTREFYKD